MISFRYHLVSIVAVLLALALGLLAGASVLDKGLVATLEKQTKEAQDRADRLEQQKNQFADFAGEAIPYLTADRLTGTEVVIVTQDGVDDSLLSEALTSLQLGGARVVAILSARSQLASEEPAVQQQLAELLGEPGTPPEELSALTARALGERLAVGPGRRGGTANAPDLLHDLLANEFLASIGPSVSDTTLREIGGIGQVVVALAGGEGEPALAPEAFLVPLVERIVERGVPVAAGESAASEYGFVSALRSDGALGLDDMVTVDDLDQSMGGVALVLGLARLIGFQQGGSYGIEGDSLIPAPSPPPPA